MREIKKIIMYIDMMAHGGAQRVMGNLADYFTNQDIEIILVNDFKLDEKQIQYDVNPKVRREYLQKINYGNVIIKNIRRIMKLRSLIEQEEPDLVLSFLGRPNKRMLLATIGLDTKKIVSVRNDPNNEYGKTFLKKAFARVLFRLADGCVFQTSDAKNYFPKAIKSKSIIIPNPVNEEFYCLERNKKVKNIVSIGRLEVQKNNMLLIQAFKNIASEFPKENIIFYCTGSKLSYLRNIVEELKMEDRIIFAGYTNYVPEKIASCKIFVLSSDYEGMPNALMEAMASGVPCVSTDCPCGGPKELIINNQDGVLVPINDVDRMSSALSELLRNDRLRKKLGDNAKKRAEKFKAERIYSIWKQYFEKVINK